MILEPEQDATLPGGDGSLATGPLIASRQLNSQAAEMARSVVTEFGRRIATSLSAYLNLDVTAEATAVLDQTFDEFIHSLGSPRCLGLLNTVPGQTASVVSFGSPLVFPMIETLLGGQPGEVLPPRRPLTEIETALLANPVRAAAGALAESWQKFAAVDYELESVDGGELASKRIAGDHAMTILRINVALTSQIQGGLDVAIPRDFWCQLGAMPEVEPLENRAEAPTADRREMLELLRPSVLDLEVVLKGCEVTLADLLSLRSGKLLLLDQPLEAPIAGVLNGSDAFTGHVCVRGGRRAFIPSG